MRTLGCILAALCVCPGCSPTSNTSRTNEITRAAPEQIGLVTEHWQIRAENGRLEAAISEVMPDDVLPVHGEEGFASQGFQVVIIENDDLEILRSSLESESPTRRLIRGEAFGWGDLATRSINENTIAMRNGRYWRMPESVLALATRGWSIPTIDGSGLYVQLVPHHITERVDSEETLRSGNVRGLMLSDPLETTLLDNQALLITTRLESPPSLDEAPSPTSTDIIPGGMEMQLPPTVAEILLDDELGTVRGIMVIHGRSNPKMRPPTQSTP